MMLHFLKNGIGNRAVIPRIILLILNKPVDFRMLAYSAHIRCHHDLHESHLLAFRRLTGNITGQHFIIELLFQKNLGVAAHGHQIGRDLDNRIHIF